MRLQRRTIATINCISTRSNYEKRARKDHWWVTQVSISNSIFLSSFNFHFHIIPTSVSNSNCQIKQSSKFNLRYLVFSPYSILYILVNMGSISPPAEGTTISTIPPPGFDYKISLNEKVIASKFSKSPQSSNTKSFLCNIRMLTSYQ